MSVCFKKDNSITTYHISAFVMAEYPMKTAKGNHRGSLSKPQDLKQLTFREN